MVSRKLKGLEIGDALEIISDDPEFKNKSEAAKIFKLLDDAKFAVEDIYFEDEDKSYKILNFICGVGGGR